MYKAQHKISGEFELDSGKMCISDPCYTRGEDGALWDADVAVGKWHIYTPSTTTNFPNSFLRSIEPASIILLHEGHAQSLSNEQNVHSNKENVVMVSNDSGYLGIFDALIYPKGFTGNYGETETFYGHISMPKQNRSVVLDKGFVFRVPLNHGHYPVYVKRDEQKRIFSIRIP